MEEMAFARGTHSPRTALLNAMRYLATRAELELESQEVYARSIFTLARALVEVSVTGNGLAELRRRSPRVQARIPVLLVWKQGEEKHREHSFTISVSRFGCALPSHEFLEPRSTVSLEHEGRTIVGKIVYSLKDHSRKLVEVGIGFEQDGRDFWGESVPQLECPESEETYSA